MLENTIVQSLVLLPLVLSVFLSFRVLNLCDLTVDGTYVLGGAVYAKVVSAGYGPLTGLLCALMAGAIAGTLVATMQRQHRIPPLIAGILASFALFSLNLKIMERPNISLRGQPLIFDLFPFFSSQLFSLALVGLLTAGAVAVIYRSSFGLHLRAFGCNANLLRLRGKRVEGIRTAGLAVSNALAALSGVLATNLQGFADYTMGIGMVMITIALVIIGQQFALYLSRSLDPSLAAELTCLFIASLLYFAISSIFIQANIDPVNVKVLISLSLIAFLFLTGKDRQFMRGFGS